jgi:hypothetical protein
MITAGLRKDDPAMQTPSEAELREAQLQGLIHHLTGDHSLCWSEVCWHKNNPELVLQEPHLMNASESELKSFEDMLGTIFRLPQGQGLVTTTRTSHSEAFNRRKLVFLDKKIDYWKTYMTRHACTVMLQNLGLVEMMKAVRSGCGEEGFCKADIQNLEKIAKYMKEKKLRNRLKLEERNQILHAKYAEAQEELAGVDFSSVCIYVLKHNKIRTHIFTLQNLVYYKELGRGLMKQNQFVPSFHYLIRNFEAITKCGACACFEKVTPHGLCQMCYFYAKHGMKERLIRQQQYTLPDEINATFDEMLHWLVKKVYRIDSPNENQITAIKTYMSRQHTFVIMPTGAGKSLCFWASAALYTGLTVVFEPLIAIMQDQMVSVEFIS